MANAKEIVTVWKDYLGAVTSWYDLTGDARPQEGGCGLIYELGTPLDGRPDESLAVCDMRFISETEPHYHEEETEFYFVLQGLGRIIIDRRECVIAPGSIHVIPPRKAHYVFPERGLVIAAVNTPPFSQDRYVALEKTDLSVGYDDEQFERLREVPLKVPRDDP